MMHHNNHKFYQYAGPPSIVMGTWGDRSRTQFAPPPPPFAIPPAGVPGGRLGPAPSSRINAGYHSLQYTPSPPPHHAMVHPGVNIMPPGVNVIPPGVNVIPPEYHHHKKGSVSGSSTLTNSSKYSSHGSRSSSREHAKGSVDQQQLHKLPQV